MAQGDVMSAELERLLADPDELARVIDALSWGDQTTLRSVSPSGQVALEEWLARWLLRQARVRHTT